MTNASLPCGGLILPVHLPACVLHLEALSPHCLHPHGRQPHPRVILLFHGKHLGCRSHRGQNWAVRVGRVVTETNSHHNMKDVRFQNKTLHFRAQWLRGRASDSRLREPGFESCAAVLKPWASFFTLHCSSSLSCIHEYLAIDSGGYVYEQPSRINCSIWLDASQRSRDGV